MQRSWYIPLQTLVDWIYPPECPLTRDSVAVHGQLSPSGWARLRFIVDPLCVVCGVPFDVSFDMPERALRCVDCMDSSPAFDQARAALVYDDASRDLILPFKHGDRLHLQATLTRLLHHGLDRLDPRPWDRIVPVPLHHIRAIKRRYNQSTLLAQCLARKGIAPVDTRVLARVRATPSQGHLSRDERAHNVAGAFAVPDAWRAGLAGANILLIDDVMTTGATLNSCAQTLKDHGASYVGCLTLARAIPDIAHGAYRSDRAQPHPHE